MSSMNYKPELHANYWQLARPGGDCIELPQLDHEGIDYSDRLVELLFDLQPGRLEINVGPYLDNKLRSYFFSSMVARQKVGRPIFGLGFPVVLIKVDEEWSSFPLMIARLDLESSQNGMIISKGKRFVLQRNQYLIKHLRETKGVDLNKLFDGLFAKPFLHEKDLNKTLTQIANQTGIPLFDKHLNWTPLPDQSNLNDFEETGTIVKTAYLGSFPPLLTERLEVRKNGGEADVLALGHPFGLLHLDPFQEKAYQGIADNRISLVQGPKGSGKTHLLAQIVTNALANGKNCLVLSNYLAPLKTVLKRISALELRTLSCLYQQEGQDDHLLLELLKSVVDLAQKSVLINNEGIFKQHLEKISRAKAKLDEQYHLVREPLINNANWTELVGRFLHHNQQEGREKLAMQLNPQQFAFTDSEYQSLSQSVGAGFPLFNRTENINSSLQDLHPRLFSSVNKGDSQAFVDKQLSFNIAKGKKLLDHYNAKQSQYAEALFLYFDNFSTEIGKVFRGFQDRFEEAKNELGSSLFKGEGPLAVFSVFSQKQKRIKEERQGIRMLYRQLVKKFKAFRPFDFEFPDSESFRSLQQVEEFISAFKGALNHWRGEVNHLIQDDLSRLSVKTAVPALGFNKVLEELEYDLELFVKQVNEEKLLKDELANKMLIVPQQQQFLEQIVAGLERIYQGFYDFEQFYDWQKYWLALPEKDKIVVKALTKSRAENWSTAFESWYGNQCLIKFNRTGLPQHNLDLPEYCAQHNKFKKILRQQIGTTLNEKRLQIIERIKRKNKSFYNTLIQRKPDRGLDHTKIVRDFFAEIVDALPVFCSTPATASSILDQNHYLFDYVLIEDTQAMHAHEVEAALKWGKKVIFFAEDGYRSAEMQEENPSGLTHLKSSFQPTEFALRNIHKWQPGNLQPLVSNKLLYPELSNSFKIDYIQLESRYDEQLKVNEEEAQLVLRLLNDINETPQRTFPKVGIVCFTEEQRNLLLGYLNRIKQQDLPGADKIKQLERNGLGICHLKDLVGEDFDLLILSVTYGGIDLKGTLTRDIDELDSTAGNLQIKQLIDAGQNHLQVISSIPVGMLESFADSADEPAPQTDLGKASLASYLLFLKAIHDDNDQKIGALAQAFYQNNGTATHDHATARKKDLFLDEVVRTLTPYLPPDALQTADQADNKFGFPYLIRKHQEPDRYYYFLVEGFLSTSPVIDYNWEYQRIKYLENKGLEAIPVWSVNWWKNSENEVKRIARQVQRLSVSSE